MIRDTIDGDHLILPSCVDEEPSRHTLKSEPIPSGLYMTTLRLSVTSRLTDSVLCTNTR